MSFRTASASEVSLITWASSHSAAKFAFQRHHIQTDSVLNHQRPSCRAEIWFPKGFTDVTVPG